MATNSHEVRGGSNRPFRNAVAAVAAAVLLAACGAPSDAPAPAAPDQGASSDTRALTVACENPNGAKVLEPGQPPAFVFGTVEAVAEYRRCLAGGSSTTNNNLYFHGGSVESGSGMPKVYVVFWGSQWNNNDPSGEASILQSFFNGVGGSSWANDDTQYCQNVASGTYTCAGVAGAVPAGNATGTLAGYWYDNGSAAPNAPRQSQIANEAARAAAHFGNTTAGSNADVQYVIATANGYNASGFGHQYCAWHSSASSPYGAIAYTNMPYVTDAGASCGANFNGLGANAGITIVGGHEFAESVTDPFPSSGWLDSGGSETGDKCAWISSGQGAAGNITLSTGTFPVQSLWSNATSDCVLSYP